MAIYHENNATTNTQLDRNVPSIIYCFSYINKYIKLFGDKISLKIIRKIHS